MSDATTTGHATSVMAGVPDGMQPFVVAEQVEQRLKNDADAKVALVFVARDGERMLRMSEILSTLLPGHPVLTLPAWDCLPYDRVSPNMVTTSARMNCLSHLLRADTRGAIVITSTNALVQKLVPPQVVADLTFHAVTGEVVDSDALIKWAQSNGYLRVPTVREAGEFAVRGGLIDLYPAGFEQPFRFDFFGSILESIRTFDAETQRTSGNEKSISLLPMSEIALNPDTIKTFRRNYTAEFGGHTIDDPLYAAISSGQQFPGAEHWLPFFYGELAELTDFTGDTPFVFDDQSETSLSDRRDSIRDYYDARKLGGGEEATGSVKYNAIAPDALYDVSTPMFELAGGATTIQLSPFVSDQTNQKIIDRKGALPRNFAAERQAADSNLFEAVQEFLSAAHKARRKTIITCWSEGTRERMVQVLQDHGLQKTRLASNWSDAQNAAAGETVFVVLELETGFQTPEQVVLTEQDIVGERLVRNRRRKKASDALTEASSLSPNDLVVHVDHGVGRFIGLRPIEAAGVPHDCVEIEYAKGDKLYLPVENIELLSRYGEANPDSHLDRLGGVAWQAKKSKLKQRIREMADQLIKIAAARELSTIDPINAQTGLYDEFATRFPYEETEDQLNAIDAIFDDLSSGRIMDRLVCGDVGFGKTEVALRAAFAVALSGRQVAVVVPTTLLARQHFRTFKERFAGLPIRVAQLSRLVSSADAKATKAGMEDGGVDIVIGTHALLAKTIKFRDVGLLVIDEEQHFGVAHKERLKELKSDVHVLTLTATPIPRTLQLALTGVRDLSLLGTPPVDRLAIRTFIAPFDALSVREALLREKFRGGQAFYVVPRIKDQAEIADFLRENVPEVSFVVANGQMPPGELDDIMNAFYDGKFDVLVSTTIVESGLDIPNANTMIVHRAEMFGLAQLYQIRGRIGRSKTRAYAMFTVPAKRVLTQQAERRLQVLQSLESLGAGFQLASHDLDIRGAGNLLGDEQSGQIREVGYELYQAMLEEAVASLRAGETLEESEEGEWSPQISLGMPVMIPESYVPDLQVRMQLYRRLGDLTDTSDVDGFGAELIDRFGPLPDEVQALLKTIVVKALCREANVEKIDAGPKGVVITLRNGEFANPSALVGLVADPAAGVTLKPDQRLVFSRNWPTPDSRLKGAATILMRLVKMTKVPQ